MTSLYIFSATRALAPGDLDIQAGDQEIIIDKFMELALIESGQGIHFTEKESHPIAAGDGARGGDILRRGTGNFRIISSGTITTNACSADQ